MIHKNSALPARILCGPIFLIAVANGAWADDACDASSCRFVISAKDQNGNEVQYTYGTKDRLLLHTRTHANAVDYIYSGDGLLVYAITNRDGIYRASRDRQNRTSRLSGINSTEMSVIYEGDSHTPQKIEIQLAGGQIVTPYISKRSSGSATSLTDYSLQAIDSILVTIYEAYALPEMPSATGLTQQRPIEVQIEQ